MATAYETARAGGSHANFLRDYGALPDHLIEKALRSLGRQVELHQAWIADPTAKLGGQFDREYARRLVEQKWPKDILRQREQIEILRGILRERRK